MEFLKERCYTALNADELKQGDKVIVDYDVAHLKRQVICGDGFPYHEIKRINAEDITCRFNVGDGNDYPLAYLVEIAENCTNCGCVHCWYREKHGIDEQRLHTCSRRIEPKTEQKAEKHYRPFRDTDELIKVWDAKYRYAYGLERIDRGLDMPHIWVKRKGYDTDKGNLIICFSDNGCSMIDVDEIKVFLWETLLEEYEFLDGSPCGVEE